ncbi:MAG: DUF488 domain-containing protein [Candidatus Hydrogenedentes bacterium]|nr:DUF488 domain-containing protein [Candidatus Hydrogenedentota bacterium]
MTVFSIGYERRSVDELIDILRTYHVAKLIDVRELPLSRRKGFSKSKLSEKLREAGISYSHIRAAGNPHRAERADVQRCLRLYRDYLSENPNVVDAVIGEFGRESVAVLCYEREHECCHRSILLAGVEERGYRIEAV